MPGSAGLLHQRLSWAALQAQAKCSPSPQNPSETFCCCQRDSPGLCAPKDGLTHPLHLKAVPPNSTKSRCVQEVQCQQVSPSSLQQHSARAIPVLLPHREPWPAGEHFPVLPSRHPVTPQILERTLEPDSSDEEPPPVYSPPAYESQALGSRYPRTPPTPPPR